MSRRTGKQSYTVVITYCDKCGADQNVNEQCGGTWLHINWSDGKWIEADLCPKCYRKFRKWIGV